MQVLAKGSKVESGKRFSVVVSGQELRAWAEKIAALTDADIFEIVPAEPYTAADLNWNDRNSRTSIETDAPSCRPGIDGEPVDLEGYSMIFIGYPIWWASIPMPIATFLESYDFSGKRIIPFCSHGGGRFGQSLTEIAKLAPDADMGQGLAVSYSGGASLADDIKVWLEANKIYRDRHSAKCKALAWSES